MGDKSLRSVMVNKLKNISLVYLAAGMSSRFGGKVKALAQVGPNGETLIEYSLNQALSSGFSKIIFIVSSLTIESLKGLFGDNYKGVPVEYALQYFDPIERDRPWGTAQAISVLDDFVDDGFVVCTSDDIYGSRAFQILFDHLQKSDSAAILGYKLIDNLSNEGTSNRGVIDCYENNKVKSIKEVLAIDPKNLASKGLKPETLVSMSIFAFPKEVVYKLGERFENFKNKNKGDRKIEFFLPSEISYMIEKNELKMIVYPVSENTIGLTYPEDEEVVKRFLASKVAKSDSDTLNAV